MLCVYGVSISYLPVNQGTSIDTIYSIGGDVRPRSRAINLRLQRRSGKLEVVVVGATLASRPHLDPALRLPSRDLILEHSTSPRSTATEIDWECAIEISI